MRLSARLDGRASGAAEIASLAVCCREIERELGLPPLCEDGASLEADR